uniref:DUF1248 domain-containing protein n=1 Tax=Caenorhabditis tropicalis TaxID=1561998 RepID=A0A1I7UA53_9PELO
MLTIARRFSRAANCGNQIIIDFNNVDIVKNIQKREYDAIWNTVDSVRSDIKKTDLKKFKEAFGDDFHQALTFVENTDRLIAMNYHTIFRPLNNNPDPEKVVFRGKIWISGDVSGNKIDEIITKQSHEVGFSVGNHSIGHATNKTINSYKKTTGSANFLQKCFVSHYDFGDFCIPEHVNSDGIIIKNARDVPDKDILNYDAKIFKYERSKYVLGQLREDFGRVAYDENGEVVGFGRISTYPSGECCINPMYADNIDIARNILKDILEEMTLDSDKYWRLKLYSHDYSQESYGYDSERE